jgi:murein DD-endopeptidase MepM/ murein hydrolase activator NlpD
LINWIPFHILQSQLINLMNPKPSDVSTIMILNRNGNPQSLQVKTKHLKRIKHYAAAVGAIFVMLAGFIFYLKAQNTRQEQEKMALLSQIVKLKGEIPANLQKAGEQHSAQGYIQQIEGKLKTINDYLRHRGLKGFSTNGTGGDGNAEGKKLSDKEVYSLYNDYLNQLVGNVAFTPMGYPKISSFTSFFGYRSDPFNSASAEFHPGVDFRGAHGDEAKSTANGKVVFAGWYGGYGNCVRIDHGNSFETLYGHLSRITVKVGQQVTVGEKVGEIGSTGHSTGTHLHYEVRKNGKPVNPINFLTLNK